MKIAFHTLLHYGCSITDWLWSTCEQNLVFDYLHDLQLLSSRPFHLEQGLFAIQIHHVCCSYLAFPYDSDRFRQLLDFSCKSLMFPNVQVDALHPRLIFMIWRFRVVKRED